MATDLASRGLDIPELNFIIHYELPRHKEEFIHRNGRTARVNAKGTAYILKGKDEQLPDFIKSAKAINISKKATLKPDFGKHFLYRVEGRIKFPKATSSGLFMKQGGLTSRRIGYH